MLNLQSKNEVQHIRENFLVQVPGENPIAIRIP